ncbi:TIGR03557 family F420-dependent LLM class oxidoreductase [Conexibacter stalactiti]|uniref:TIGR03557 family F420-dependent LLM class oxidoreductase n=1 Tax=Conexibacter stalactiti TaxID=1940611 RepID=A0ABU4HQB3_9ACTN|nr:TIGR03557 family F420-dependent LLM class oxidoreductase [Conexibacter stalactiti]MDW5594229.1 TIGR03557 family F420-dependent LLM class oxidoreductase [Conexibacter stalactiti]MEC5034871.1 TIGR03557 family F420-dependent LLM class oxidoreductase [Conexibacter stalactiti]
MRIGCFLSSEEFGPRDLVAQAIRAEQAGFSALWISDHYHPWIDEQGHSPFVWSVIGAIAQATDLPLGTGVTCPTMRIHPAVTAQAAATSALLLGGRFTFGVGSGEALNEHILGDRWPGADERIEMLEEAIAVMRELWTGSVVHHDGTHYAVEHARLYDVPDEPPPVIVSAFGPKAASLAARVGDGFATTSPDQQLIDQFRREGGRGPVQAGTKVCFGPDKGDAVKTVHRLWPNEALPGELAQVLPTPPHFEQAVELVSEQMIADSPTPCGPDIDEHVAALQAYADAGVDELYVQQVGPLQDAFFETWAAEVLPRFDGG